MTARRLGGFALTTLIAMSAAPLVAQDAVAPEPAAQAAAVTPAAAPLRLALQPESKIWFKGGSTVRDFECQATSLAGTFAVELATGQVDVAALGSATAQVALDIPVAQIDCGNGTMNDHMRKALRADERPTIHFRYGGHEVVANPGGGTSLKISGWLTISGEERVVALEAAATAEDAETLRVVGSYELDMTEYGVKPPKLMLGTLKVHDKVTVHYDLVLRP